MGSGEDLDQEFSLNGYQQDRMAWSRENAILLGGSRIPHMYPGEAIKTVTAARPSSNFGPFENAMLRNIASGLGLSAQQLSNDWSNVNYSSARSAALEAGKTMDRRQHDFFVGFAMPIWGALMEEMIELDGLPLPSGVVPEFSECRSAFARCLFLGPPKGWVNPVDERAGAILGMDAGFSTLENEAASQGSEWEELLHQRAYEIAKFKELGIPLPEWAGALPAKGGDNPNSASKVDKPPQKPEAE